MTTLQRCHFLTSSLREQAQTASARQAQAAPGVCIVTAADPENFALCIIYIGVLPLCSQGRAGSCMAMFDGNRLRAASRLFNTR
jgi:hypothetical protein